MEVKTWIGIKVIFSYLKYVRNKRENMLKQDMFLKALPFSWLVFLRIADFLPHPRVAGCDGKLELFYTRPYKHTHSEAVATKGLDAG